MEAIIPAAGYATRLYPLTLETPKALLDMQGEPVLNYVVRKILTVPNLKRITLISNDKFYEHFKAWEEGFDSPVPIGVLNDGTKSEEDRLGAIGDKHFALRTQKIEDDVIDVSADNLFTFSLKEMHAYFLEKKAPVIGLVDVKTLEAAKRFGVVKTDSNGRIVLFQEKPSTPQSTLASTGIYFYPKEHLRYFDRYLEEGKSQDAPGYFLEWLHNHIDVYGYTFKRQWFDIGSLEMLEQARQEFKEDLA